MGFSGHIVGNEIGQARKRSGTIPTSIVRWNHVELKLMTDLIFVAVMALIFVVGEVYAHWCEKL
jgi:hypothetical protein